MRGCAISLMLSKLVYPCTTTNGINVIEASDAANINTISALKSLLLLLIRTPSKLRLTVATMIKGIGFNARKAS
jgi:hypothetical protein